MTTVVIGLALSGQAVGEYVYGSERIPAAVSAQLKRSGVANIAVHLGFTPESFNITFLSGMGNVAQTSGTTVYMVGVSASAVRSIAGQYWVASVQAWKGSQ